MNFTDIRETECIPIVYLGPVQGDGSDAIRTCLDHAFASFDPSAPSTMSDTPISDNLDFSRLGDTALNKFLVDMGMDALIWGNADNPAGALTLHIAVAPWPKVAHEHRHALRFRARITPPLDAGKSTIVVAQVLGAAVAETARNRPVPRPLIERCIAALEAATATPLDGDIYLNALETLAALHFVCAEPEDDVAHLQTTISHNVHVCAALGISDKACRVRLLKMQAHMLTVLGARTGDHEKITAAIGALKTAAIHVCDHVGLAQLDMLLADCKMQLGLLTDDDDMLEQARDLFKWVLPFFYRNLSVENWATAQARLAGVNWHLMQRTCEKDQAEVYALSALDAVNEALTFYNANAFPLEWARISAQRDEILNLQANAPVNLGALGNMGRRKSAQI